MHWPMQATLLQSFYVLLSPFFYLKLVAITRTNTRSSHYHVTLNDFSVLNLLHLSLFLSHIFHFLSYSHRLYFEKKKKTWTDYQVIASSFLIFVPVYHGAKPSLYWSAKRKSSHHIQWKLCALISPKNSIFQENMFGVFVLFMFTRKPMKRCFVRSSSCLCFIFFLVAIHSILFFITQ